MKYMNKLTLGIVLAAGLFTACSDKDDVDIPGGLALDKDEIAIGPQGGTEQIAIAASQDWVASTSEPWLMLSPANGVGSVEGTIKVDSTLSNTLRSTELSFQGANGQNLVDYQISVDMAKQICMVQKNKLGRLYRQYFLDLEKAWNTPEQVMRRALQMAKKSEEELKQKCNMLGSEVIKQQAMIEEMAPKVSYLDEILQCPSLVLTTQIAKDYGYSARAFNQLLHHYNIQYKANDQWVLYAAYQGKGYVHSTTYSVKSGNEIIRIRMQTEWTQKGRRFLYDFLKKEGIVPMIERGNTNAGGSK